MEVILKRKNQWILVLNISSHFFFFFFELNLKYQVQRLNNHSEKFKLFVHAPSAHPIKGKQISELWICESSFDYLIPHTINKDTPISQVQGDGLAGVRIREHMKSKTLRGMWAPDIFFSVVVD